MQAPSLAKYLILAWGVPIVIVLLVRNFTPDPSQSRLDFPQRVFKPARVWIEEKEGANGADYFELLVESPEGDVYFHRAPNLDPIAELDRKFPKEAELSIRYMVHPEGNVLMEIVSGSPPSPKSILAFECVMGEYSTRRRVVYIVAVIWWALVNLLFYAEWKKADVPDGVTTSAKLK